jgi:catechol 2,3-dioxygenase-like lactoylglutathione lyase family enzyme
VIKSIKHTGIVTQHLSTALKFYKDLLGLKILKEGRLKGKLITELLGFGIHTVNLEYVKLSTPNNNCLLEIYYFIEPKEFKIYPNFNHICFEVNNLDKLCKKLEDNGIDLLSKPKTINNCLIPLPTYRVVFCRDYDGNLIELSEKIK